MSAHRQVLHWSLLLGLSWALAAPVGAALPPAKVLQVDTPRVEAETETLKRVRAQAEAHQPALLKAQQQEGIELALSEILTVLPEAVSTVAKAAGADLVIQSSAWPEAAGAPPQDVTAEVMAEIDRRLADLNFQVP